jgi:hypothetical protein
MMIYASTGDLVTNLGGILTGVASLLAIVGSGIGFVIRSRRTARNERLRTEAAASLAAQEARRSLEEKLEKQHKAQIDTLVSQAQDLLVMHNTQRAQYEAQIKDLRDLNSHLLDRVLNESRRDDDE